MISDIVGALGSWDVTLAEETPDEVLSQLGYFGHVAVVQGRVDVEGSGDALLRAARYVGVLRGKERPAEIKLSGVGMEVWLGDEDNKGHVFETPVVLTGASFTDAINAVLPPAVRAGTIFPQLGTYTGTHQYVTPRDALDIICAAFDCEWRINNDGTLDAGKVGQLYQTNPTNIVVRKGAGKDMDLTALGAEFDSDTDAIDYSTRVLLLGQDQNNGTILESVKSAPSVPYKDLFGNPVERTRMVSDPSITTGAVDAAAQLQLNRFNRTKTSLRVTASGYELEGTFLVGDYAYVYDPETGIFDVNNEVYFNGDVLHPDIVRITAIAYPVTAEHTVAFRTQNGVWIDLTPYVAWETGSNAITVGDMPLSLTNPGTTNPVLARTSAAQGDTIPPNPPTGLQLTSYAVIDATGNTSAVISAGWVAPTTNVDNSVITDFDHYLVAYRSAARTGVWQYTQTSSTTVDIPAIINLDYVVQVAAVDTSGNTSAWTAASTIHTAADATPPNTPSQPTVSNYLGQLRISWDGKDVNGAAMPPDFNRVNVYVSTTSTFTPSVSNLVASMSDSNVVYATAAYGATRYVKLVAIDNSGNASTPSTVVSGATSQVVSADVFDGAIGTAKLADLAVTNAKINDLAVNDAKIGNLSVGKLTAGTMSADVVMGGRFATALTGKRVELNATGLHQWDASNNMLVDIGSGNALITGTFKTAASGRRIEIGSGGSVGDINFYAPDGTASIIRAFTQSGGLEAIQFGIPIDAAGLWNRINYNNDRGGYASYQAARHEFLFDDFWHIFQTQQNSTHAVIAERLRLDTAGFYVNDQNAHGRLAIDTNFTYWDSNANGRLVIDSTGDTRFINGNNYFFNFFGGGNGGYVTLQNPAGLAAQSGRIGLINQAGYGVKLKSYYDGTTVRLEVRNVNDDAFENCFASSFQVISDMRAKADIRDIDPSEDMLGKVVATKVKHYTRPRTDDVPAPDQIGLIAQEAPAQITTGNVDDEHSGMGVDLYQMTSMLWAAVQQMNTELRAEIATLKGKVK